MKAMIVNAYGDVDVFEAAQIAKPEIKSGHVRIKISATSVNTVDTMIRAMGKDLPLSPELPAVLGMDFAGTVEAVGEGVFAFKVGDEVYGCAGGLADLQGTLAEYIVADAKLIALKPKTMSMREAAALPLVGITAYEGLMRAGVKNTNTVLVQGGAGGVGHIAIQIAKYLGANVYTTVGREEHISLVERLGATPINYRTESVPDYVEKHTAGKGFDVVFDSVGGQNMLKSFDATALNGQVITTVSMLELDLTQAHFKGLSIHVVFMLIPMLHNLKREEHGKILCELAKIADAGHLSAVLDGPEFTLNEIGAAHERLASGKATGKIVVSV
ncbi:zinc-dependent alcohol dehydrogenase family protein [Saccharophagus degradans]|uniref:Zinc-dependent alcohol dehydrogenase family protein n=1 Tax=Saccharophagus degradans TaxID=86304 RepID=A0AAW7X1K9_9GAMM|nr:zinc-dependent alcohol dehydrogenase family protein [Saccharophagus degradans]MDO6421220.1 zinc-dependent alcohol dehydrogenase family protein [Saccharophagus degradans]MDO6605869.1 zinc-dependent alcohol dehydrogenase family protein [Saccharophagus degradans]